VIEVTAKVIFYQ